MQRLTIVPAYGRDYKTAESARLDWQNNKDFIINDMSSPYDGKPINRLDADQIGINVSIRFNRLKAVTYA